MPVTKSAPRAVEHDRDFFAWTQDQAKRLRDTRPNSIDWENVAEEIESVGRSEKPAIESNLHVLLVHLLKWAFQPDKRGPSWRGSIIEHRRRVLKTVADSPSLRDYPALVLGEEYETARLKAAGETGIAEDAFPRKCPFTIEQVLDQQFWPESPQE